MPRNLRKKELYHCEIDGSLRARKQFTCDSAISANPDHFLISVGQFHEFIKHLLLGSGIYQCAAMTFKDDHTDRCETFDGCNCIAFYFLKAFNKSCIKLS